MSDDGRYPPGTTEADVEEAFGDGEEPLRLPPRKGPAWRSPRDRESRGKVGRYVVAVVDEAGVAEEDSRKETLQEARARHYQLEQEFSRNAYGGEVVVWDSQDPERKDLSSWGTPGIRG